MPIKAAFFDVGETLVDETRQWGLWADWLDVPRLTFFPAFGVVIGQGNHHRRVFELFVDNFDLEAASKARAAAGVGYALSIDDFYLDAVPALVALRKMGLLVGIAGNQPREAEAQLVACGAPADIIASSAQ